MSQVGDQMLKDMGVSSAGFQLRLVNAVTKLPPAPFPDPSANAAATTAAAGWWRQRGDPRR